MRRLLVHLLPGALQKGHRLVSGVFSSLGAREMCTGSVAYAMRQRRTHSLHTAIPQQCMWPADARGTDALASAEGGWQGKCARAAVRPAGRVGAPLGLVSSTSQQIGHSFAACASRAALEAATLALRVALRVPLLFHSGEVASLDGGDTSSHWTLPGFPLPLLSVSYHCLPVSRFSSRWTRLMASTLTTTAVISVFSSRMCEPAGGSSAGGAGREEAAAMCGEGSGDGRATVGELDVLPVSTSVLTVSGTCIATTPEDATAFATCLFISFLGLGSFLKKPTTLLRSCRKYRPLLRVPRSLAVSLAFVAVRDAFGAM